MPFLLYALGDAMYMIDNISLAHLLLSYLQNWLMHLYECLQRRQYKNLFKPDTGVPEVVVEVDKSMLITVVYDGILSIILSDISLSMAAKYIP